MRWWPCQGLLALVFLAAPIAAASPDTAPRVPITPRWALECWLWEADHSNAAAITELLDGFAEHDIPARTIILDAPWSTRYNDFEFDRQRYPDPEKFFQEMKRRGIRVVLWMTSRVNSQSEGIAIKDSRDWFDEAKAKGYLAGDGYEQHWWLGWGGFVDYANPAAMTWWHGMQQHAFDLGIDGWKLDDASLFYNSPIGTLTGTRNLPSAKERKGWMTNRDYVDHFYRDEYQHGLKQRGGDFITLARSIDNRVYPKGFAPLDAAPVTWVGDQNHTWKASQEGIEEGLNYILEAARQGYCVIGSDVAGYHGPKIIPPRLYIRWAQFSTFCGLFLNGGHGERRLWKRSDEELQIVRKFAWLHNELVPYIYSHTVECHGGGKPLMRPIGPSDARGNDQGDFHYLFGDDFLVAPIHEDSPRRKVHLPAGKWRYLFDDGAVIEGPATIDRDFPLDEFPVYVREGAIVPLEVSRAYSGLGDRDSTGLVTWNIYPADGSQFTLHHPGGTSTTLSVRQQNGWTITLAGTPQPHLLRVYLPAEPQAVQLDGKPLVQGTDWRYDAPGHRLWIRTPQAIGGRYEIRPAAGP
jgi:alpha-glucosidase (family GH31 glycosyl hydrolase)